MCKSFSGNSGRDSNYATTVFALVNVLIVNDTRVDDNIGCHATMDELIRIIKETRPDSNISTIPFETDYERFENSQVYPDTTPHPWLKKVTKKLVSTISNSIRSKPVWDHEPREFNFYYWRSHYISLLSNSLKNRILSSDLIVINMEGTIHHNAVGGIVLMSIAKLTKDLHKKVALVNGSYQAMSPLLSQEVLSQVDFLSVREPRSHAYLSDQGIKAHLIPDFVFRIEFPEHNQMEHPPTRGYKKKCLYTPGVLGSTEIQKSGQRYGAISDHLREIRKAGYEPIFLKIEGRENPLESALRAQNVQSIDLTGSLNPAALTEVFNKNDLLVTGRYHVGIFGLMNGIKTIFLPSNTFKIEGLLELLDTKHL